MFRGLSRLRAGAARAVPSALPHHPLARLRTTAVLRSVKEESKAGSAVKAALPVMKGLSISKVIDGAPEELGLFFTAVKGVMGVRKDQKKEQAPKPDYAKRIGYTVGMALTVYNMFYDKDKSKSGIGEHVALIHARSEIATSESLLPAMRNVFKRLVDTEIKPAAIMVVTRDGISNEAQLASIQAEWDKLLKSHNVSNVGIPILVCAQDRLYESNDKMRAAKLATRFNHLSKPAILYCGSEAEAQHLAPIYANAMKNSGTKFEIYDAWPKSILARVFK